MNLLGNTIALIALATVAGTAAAAGQSGTFDDCKTQFEAAKSLFDSTLAQGEPNCVRLGSSLNVFLDGELPQDCPGSHREWHLEAKAVAVGKDSTQGGMCSIRLLGASGEGCGLPQYTRQLDADDAAQWRNFLQGQLDCKPGKP